MAPTSRLFVAFSVIVALASSLPLASQAPYVQLFDGKTLHGWVVENTTDNNFTVADGVISVSGPNGWLRSAEQYSNFSLRVEVRFLTDDADSGLFVRAPGPPSHVFFRGWPANAYQVQVRDMSKNRTTNPLWAGNLYRHRVPAQGDTTYNSDTALVAIKATGEWQVFEVDAFDDRLVTRINGVEVLRAGGVVNRTGYIGIQGEAGKLEYRRIEIQQR